MLPPGQSSAALTKADACVRTVLIRAGAACPPSNSDAINQWRNEEMINAGRHRALIMQQTWCTSWRQQHTIPYHKQLTHMHTMCLGSCIWYMHGTRSTHLVHVLEQGSEQQAVQLSQLAALTLSTQGTSLRLSLLSHHNSQQRCELLS